MTSASVDAVPFMVRAGVQRFSLCFNDGGSPGAMKLGIGSLSGALSNIGQFHWGLGLKGVKAGTNDALVICGDTPCAAIPDSGTTFMMGPAAQIRSIFDGLCDEWPRCRQEMENKTGIAKSSVFTGLLRDCSSWLSDASQESINEVPAVKLILSDGAGHSQEVELTAWAYITETTHSEYETHFKHLLDFIPTALSVDVGTDDTASDARVCVPSFGVNDYTSANNGPIWILGTPLFFEYTVNYDMGSGDSRGKMSFSKQPCQTCSGSSAGFLSGRTLRKTSGAPRTPSIDTSVPL
jgi:hypothetical protein